MSPWLELACVSSCLKEQLELSLEQGPRRLLVFLFAKWDIPSLASDLPKEPGSPDQWPLRAPAPQASLCHHPCPGPPPGVDVKVWSWPPPGPSPPAGGCMSLPPRTETGNELSGLSHRQGSSPKALQVGLSSRSRRPCSQLHPPLLVASRVSTRGPGTQDLLREASHAGTAHLAPVHRWPGAVADTQCLLHQRGQQHPAPAKAQVSEKQPRDPARAPALRSCCGPRPVTYSLGLSFLWGLC